MAAHELNFNIPEFVDIVRERHPGLPQEVEVSIVAGTHPAHICFKWTTPDPVIKKLPSKLDEVREREANE